jgi:gliding motility-associated-like protein
MRKIIPGGLNLKSSVIHTYVLTLVFALFSFYSNAQVFWTEAFSNGCASGCLVTSYTGPNGTWTMTNTGTNAASANTWYISGAENGEPAGNCGTSGTDPSLHVGSTTLGDIGAAYDASRTTDKRAESPLINCTGFSNIAVNFNYIGLGQTCATDWCDALYSSDGGLTWFNLQTCMVTTVCGSGQGMWTAYAGTLPAACDNNPNVKIAFRWRNNNSAGSDPSFAVDDITLSAVTATNSITTGTISGSPFCACASVSVPFTSSGTFTAGNIYTAQLSDAAGSFAAPVSIGTLASTANTGTIAATIPCATTTGSGYRIRVISSAPPITGSDNGVDLSITAPISVTVTDASICSGGTASLVASGGTTYSWSPGAVPTGVNTADASPAVTTTYTVTGTSGGCTDTAHATVTVTTISVSVTSATICPGGTASLVASGGTTYSWSPGAVPTGVNTADASPAITTTYTVTGTTSGCTDTAHAVVTVVSGLNVTATNASICAGGVASLSASGATSYTWSAGAVATGTNTADAAPLVTTTYTVTGTSGGCSDTAHATVTVLSSITVSVSSATICEGETAALTASGATTYSWSPGAVPTGVSTADASPSSTTSYTVTGTSGTCTDTAVAVVTVNPVPSVSVNNAVICSGEVATLTANGASTYAWSAGATSTGVNTASASPAATTTYTVTGTSAGCTDTAQATVTVNASPTVTVSSISICDGATGTLTANGATSYAWSAGATSTGVNTASVAPTSTTTYTVTGTQNGCTGTAVATVTVTSCNPPTANFAASTTTFCESGCVNFTDLSTGGPTTWNWAFPGATPASSTLQNPTGICYSAEGSYSVILIISNSNGSDTLIMLNYINVGIPEPVSIIGNTTINSCESTTLSALPADGTYSWGPSVNMQCGDCQTVTVAPTETQQYYVTYTSPDGCVDSDTIVVNVVDIYTYYMPTGLTPNGDGINDVIQVHGRGIDFINLKIFDRIGEKVFETSSIEDSWDGRLHKVGMNNNVFVYMLEVTFCNGETVKEQGNITLVK